MLFQRARAYPEFMTAFLDAAERAAERCAEDNWLAEEIERVVTLITPAALEDINKQFTNTEFENEIGFLREFATFRPPFVLDGGPARAAKASVALLAHFRPDLLFVRFLQQQRSDDEREAGDDDRVIESGVDVAGAGDDGQPDER